MATIIRQADDIALTSYGNGAAYLLEQAGGPVICFQYGDDADRMRADLEAIETAAPDKPTGDVLRELLANHLQPASPDYEGAALRAGWNKVGNGWYRDGDGPRRNWTAEHLCATEGIDPSDHNV